MILELMQSVEANNCGSLFPMVFAALDCSLALFDQQIFIADLYFSLNIEYLKIIYLLLSWPTINEV